MSDPIRTAVVDPGIEYPPAGDVPWLAWTNVAGHGSNEHRAHVFDAHTWLDARKLAAREFGVLIQDVDAIEPRKIIEEWQRLRADASMGRVA